MNKIQWLATLLLLVLLDTGTAFAEDQTVTVTLKIAAPIVNRTALGMLVLRNAGTVNDLGVVWTFTGQIDGKPAAASGLARARWTGEAYEGSVTEVEVWDKPGVPRPSLPLSVALRNGGNGTVIAEAAVKGVGPVSVRLGVQGIDELPAPRKGDLVISATNIAATQAVTALPRTGEIPGWFDAGGFVLMVLSAGLATVFRSSLRRGG